VKESETRRRNSETTRLPDIQVRHCKCYGDGHGVAFAIWNNRHSAFQWFFRVLFAGFRYQATVKSFSQSASRDVVDLCVRTRDSAMMLARGGPPVRPNVPIRQGFFAGSGIAPRLNPNSLAASRASGDIELRPGARRLASCSSNPRFTEPRCSLKHPESVPIAWTLKIGR
jgi:hypothetical protein